MDVAREHAGAAVAHPGDHVVLADLEAVQLEALGTQHLCVIRRRDGPPRDHRVADPVVGVPVEDGGRPAAVDEVGAPAHLEPSEPCTPVLVGDPGEAALRPLLGRQPALPRGGDHRRVARAAEGQQHGRDHERQRDCHGAGERGAPQALLRHRAGLEHLDAGQHGVGDRRPARLQRVDDAAVVRGNLELPSHPVPSMYWATRSRARASLLIKVPWRIRSARAASLYASPSTSTATIASRCSVDSSRMPS